MVKRVATLVATAMMAMAELVTGAEPQEEVSQAVPEAAAEAATVDLVAGRSAV